MTLRIGVDVGGTSIDAVCLAPGNAVLGWSKRPAPKSAGEPEQLIAGVVAAVEAALAEAQREPSEVAAVMLGTTQFVNAAIQLQGLARVVLVRLCGPATHALPPFCDMPPRLRAAIGGCYFLAEGGHEFDGCSELSPMDEGQLRGIARQVLAAGLRCVVVAGVFSPAQPAQEHRAAAVFADEAAAAAAEAAAEAAAKDASAAGGTGEALAGGVDAAARHCLPHGAEPPLLICLSHEVGQLGLLARENAAALNAALLPLARRVVPTCSAALAAAGLGHASLYFTSNDGTLLSAAKAMRLPVATFQSGPVNSLRGAALLAGTANGIVIDIGGTSTDVGVLVEGLPRPAPRAVRLAGAPTNFQAPDVLSIGLGGGSRLRFPAQPASAIGGKGAGAAAGPASSAEEGSGSGPDDATAPPAPLACTVGPDSVGARLADEALCAGGATPTATDAAVLLGRMQLVLGGRQAAVGGGLTRQQAEAAWREVQCQLEGCVEQAKTQAVAGDAPVVAVGGGAPLCGDSLAGASSVVRPRHAAVANAVGAAIAQVGGSVDAVSNMGPTPASRAAVLAEAEQQAMERALAAGARAGSTWVAVREEVPLAYLPGRHSRVRVKVIGELEVGRLGSSGTTPAAAESTAAATAVGSVAATGSTADDIAMPSAAAQPPAPPLRGVWPPLAGRGDEPSSAELAAWQPRLAPDGAWLLAPPDLHLVAIGTGILGCGGGGSPDKALLKACMQLQSSGAGSMRVISPAAVPAGGLVADVGYMGAPTVGTEKPDSGEAANAAAAAVAAYRATAAAACSGGGGSGGPPATAGSSSGGSGAGPAAAPGGVLPLVALMSFEVGGGNGLEALCAAPLLGLPVVDGDAMGRAFPELQMATPSIYGLPAAPAAVADARGNCLTVHSAASPAWLERLLRPVCAEMGASAGFSSCPLTGEQLQRVVVPHSLSLAWRLGHAVVEAQHAKRDAPAAAAAAGGGRVLFRGRIVDVQRQTSGGFARGQVVLAGSSGAAHAGSLLRADFQNENLVARLLPGSAATHLAARHGAAAQGSGEQGGAWQGGVVLTTVPDLICCVQDETGLPIATEELRYGLRAAVLGLPAHPLLTTPEALAVVGPAAFGHPGVAYAPLAQYVPPAGIPRT